MDRDQIIDRLKMEMEARYPRGFHKSMPTADQTAFEDGVKVALRACEISDVERIVDDTLTLVIHARAIKIF